MPCCPVSDSGLAVSGRFSRPAGILITGATGGLGKALAEAYAAPGGTLILQGRQERKLADLARLCEAKGASVLVYSVDLRHTDEWLSGLSRLCDQGPIDLAIVNAGVTGSIGALGQDEARETLAAIIDVNIRAAVDTVAGVLPAMRRRGRGQIALISSLSAYYGLPITPAYCGSKAFLKAYGESLRGRLSAEGIAVNVVLPGFIESAMSQAFPGPKCFVLKADVAARIIRRGLEKNRARIGFPFPLSWGMWLLSVLPPSASQRILIACGYGVRQAPAAGRICP